MAETQSDYEKVGPGYLVVAVLVVAFCFWAALGFPGFSAFVTTAAPAPANVQYGGTPDDLARLGTDMVEGLLSGKPEAQARGQANLHSLIATPKELAEVLGSEVASAVYPAYERGVTQMVRQVPPRWRAARQAAGEAFEIVPTAQSTIYASRNSGARAEDVALAERVTRETYQLNLLVGSAENGINTQFTNLVYLDGNWRMLGPWVSEYLARQTTPAP